MVHEHEYLILLMKLFFSALFDPEGLDFLAWRTYKNMSLVIEILGLAYKTDQFFFVTRYQT
jgi:hypothetical protein